MNWCPLPILDKRRAYTPADRTDVSKTIREHMPIRVSQVHPVNRTGDDYDLVESHSWLESGGFR